MKWVPLKRLVDERRPLTYGIVQAGPDTPDGVPYIRPIDMRGHRGVVVEALQRTTAEVDASYRRSRIVAGDIVVSIGPGFGKTMIVPADLDGANLTQGTARVAAGPHVDSRYLIWALQSATSLAHWQRSVGGATFRALNLGPLAQTPIPSWGLANERAIADYLDRETAQIDALIAKQEQLIATLRERRVAAAASMVGDAGGRTARIKDVAALVNGYPFDAGLFRDSGDIPLVRIRDILGSTFGTFLAREQVPDTALVRDGDLVIGMDGDFNSTLWSRGAAALNQRVCLLRETGDASMSYLSYALPTYLGVINDLTYSTTVKHLSSKQVLNIALPLPPLDEQRRVAAQLDEQMMKIDALIGKAQQFIMLAKERRAALITVAVTGQIAVPGFDPDETTKVA
ncbi:MULTISPECIES: restriction endonuclease subunit S [unclassified Agrococcus]|uniref:restriction endonuclease subunit S n=1 Tax=unclassified Agrococcus TaxID=2615065 RepID=UPI00361A5F9F